MKILRHVAFALLCLTPGLSLAADPRATLEASARVLAVRGSVRAVTLTMQGVSPVRDQASRPEIPVVDVPDRQNVLLTRDGRYRLETDTMFPGAIRFHYLTIGSPTAWASVDLIRWRDGNEIDRTRAATGDAEFCDLLLLAPGLLMDEALGRTPELAMDPASGDLRMTFRDRVDRLTTIVIDPATKLVRTASSGDTRYVYEDFRQGRDALQPQRISIYRKTRLISRWENVALAATNLEAHMFDLPAGYVERADRGPLRATALGQGAYRIDGTPSGYHTGFVVGKDAVAIFDAPIGSEEAAKVRAVIEQTAPGRRITHVVASHTHGDHIAGLPAYLETGAKVLVGKGGGAAIRRQFEAVAESAIEEISAPRTLDLGGAKVVIYPLASSHAAEMLVSYAADSRTLFQGDLFYLPEVGATPATFEGGEELSRLIAAQHLDVSHIVGVHGRSGGMSELAEGVRRRQLHGDVQRLIGTHGDIRRHANAFEASALDGEIVGNRHSQVKAAGYVEQLRRQHRAGGFFADNSCASRRFQRVGGDFRCAQ
jgi:glyoxylase-like metal-dependent hydrolase (beta-lactamase superfamily II)